ncbi:hypothetical protein ACEZ3G_06190 [Maribacter algicola]|uniref:Uncharacterized protein n=1 Tax=Meishania litoralis TaxID=3434685 RepID=A0ACC7LJ47_9FLAO
MAKNRDKMGWKPFLVNIGFYLLLGFSVLYSENVKNAMVQMQKGLPLLVLPFVFLYFPPRIDIKRRHTLYGAFIMANFLFAGYLFKYLTDNASDFEAITTPGLILFEGLKDGSFFGQIKDLWNGSFYEVLYYARLKAESKLYVHKTYASQNVLWCILIIVYFIFRRNIAWSIKILLGLVLILLMALLFYYYSLVNLALFLVLVPGYIFFRISSKKTRVAFASLIFLTGIGIFSFLNTSTQRIDPKTYEEYTRFEHPRYILDNIAAMLDKDDRNIINKCNAQLIASSTVFGLGLGDVQDQLDHCYEGLIETGKYSLDIKTQNLNPHNYYAFLWMAGGIVVLLVFLYMLFFNFSLAFKNNDLLYLALILLIGINLMAESTLSRAHGVLFFALWNSLLLIKNLVDNENDRP